MLLLSWEKEEFEKGAPFCPVKKSDALEQKFEDLLPPSWKFRPSGDRTKLQAKKLAKFNDFEPNWSKLLEFQ